MDSPYIDLQSDNQYSNVIEKIIEHRRQPLVKLEESKKTNELRIEALRAFRKELNLLGAFAKRLYGFDAVFHRRLWVAQDEANHRFVEGVVRNRTELGNYNLHVHRVASRHKITTKPFPTDAKLPAGTFSFEVNGKTYEYNFSGGSMEDFSLLFKSTSPSSESGEEETIPLEATTISKGDGTALVVLSSRLEGAKGRIRYVSDTEGLLLHLGLFQKAKPDEPSFVDYPKPAEQQKITIDDDGVLLAPRSRYSPLINKSMLLGGEKKLSFSLKILEADQDLEAVKGGHKNLDSKARQKLLLEKSFPVRQRLQVDELILDSELMKPYVKAEPKDDSDSDSTKEAEKEATELAGSDEIAVLYYKQDGKRMEKVLYLGDLSEDGVVHVGSQLKKGTNAEPGAAKPNQLLLEGVEWVNASRQKKYYFSKLNYGDASEASEQGEEKNSYEPSREVAPAHGAKLSYKGVEVERDANLVEDLVPNVSLKLKAASDRPISFSIELDREQIDNALINFVGQYNLCVDFLNRFLSRREPDDSVEEGLKQTYGLFRSEYSMRLLKDKMTRMVGRVYPTSIGRGVGLLSQLGMSTLFFLGDAANIDAGKIEFDMEKYRNFVAEWGSEVASLFGYDKDRNGQFESGFAYSIEQLQKAYTKGNAVLNAQEEVLRRRIDTLETQIARKEQSVADYRSKLQKDFRELENAIREQKNMEKWFENLNPDR